MLYRVLTPVRDFTGEVAGVHFVHGEAIVDDATHMPAMQFFRRRGYGISQHDPAHEPGPERGGQPRRTREASDDPGAGGGEGGAEPPVKRPGRSASKEDVAAYAARVLGLSHEAAMAKSKVELLDLIGKHHQKEQEQ